MWIGLALTLLPAAAESVGVIRGGEWGVSRSILHTEGDVAFFRGGVAAEKRARKRGGQGGNQLKRVERGPTKKRSGTGEDEKRSEKGRGASGEGGAVELLEELFGMSKGGEVPEGAPLMACWNETKWGGGQGGKQFTV